MMVVRDIWIPLFRHREPAEWSCTRLRGGWTRVGIEYGHNLLCRVLAQTTVPGIGCDDFLLFLMISTVAQQWLSATVAGQQACNTIFS